MRAAAAILALLTGLSLPASAAAHCDSTKGPVVAAAREALESGRADRVLAWVRPEDEAAITAALGRARAVRALGPEAAALADRWFFETAVRIHRAGEGAGFSGLTDAEPDAAIAAVDRALAQGSAEELERLVVGEVKAGLSSRFAAALRARSQRAHGVAADREFVAAYVALTHSVEAVVTASRAGAAASEHAGDAHAHEAR